MNAAPSVVVHGLRDALAALRPGRAVTLLSGPGAGAYAGAAWWLGLVAAAGAECPATPMTDLLDCGDAPGAAMAALRLGQAALILDPACPAFAAVAAAAATRGGIVLPARPPAFDMAGRHRPGALEAWFSQDAADVSGR